MLFFFPSIMKDMGKAKLLISFFTSLFNGKTSLQESQASGSRVKVQSNKDWLPVEEDQVWDHLNKPDIHRSIEPAGMYPWVLRELADVSVNSLLIISESLLWMRGVLENWNKILFSLQECQACQRRKLQAKRVMQKSRYGFIKEKCLTKMIPYYNEISGLVDKRRILSVSTLVRLWYYLLQHPYRQADKIWVW